MKGLLANLITVSDISYSTALEVVAGGRLYNIVVDTEVGVCDQSVCCLFIYLFSFTDQWDGITEVIDFCFFL